LLLNKKKTIMKTQLPLLLLFFALSYGKAQTIGAFTVLPQPPTNTTPVKIATYITTNNLSNFISKSFTVNSQQNIISLELCYYMTMMTAIGQYVDTFAVGNLNPGNYTIQLLVNMSSTNNSCVPGSNNSATGSFIVTTATGIQESEAQQLFHVFPNPVKNILVIEHLGATDLTCSVRNTLGQVELEQILTRPKEGIDMGPLAPGVYFIELKSAAGTKRLKVVKE
jgi:hypothetical protein